jgi:hypothetical protein
MLEIEEIWEQVLCRDSESIRKAFAALDRNDRRSLTIHLQKMVTETGWQPEQRKSAQIALDAIKE